MTEDQKLEYLISPEKFFPARPQRGALLGNLPFIESVSRHCELLAESQYWPREKLENIQTVRLRALTLRVSSRSPFWNRLFKDHGFSSTHAILTDLRKLPILSRANLLELGDDAYARPLPEDGALYERRSSGTTGIPLKLVYSEREMLMGFMPLLFRHPAFEKLPLVELLSKKPFVVLGMPGFWHICKDDFFAHIFQTMQSLDLENPELRKEIYESIRGAAPAILVGYGSLIAKLAEWASKDCVSLPLLAVRTSSEPISSQERELINQILNVPVVNMLSGNGTGWVGFECPENPGKFHVNSEFMILEVADENGNVLPDGEEGELVVSAFTYTLTPIIRYGHNDIGRIIPGPCPCGRTLPLFEFSGRRGYEIVFPGGRRMRMMHLYSILWQNGLGKKSKQIQIIQNRIDGLQIIIVPRRPFSKDEERKIYSSLDALFGKDKMNIEIKYAGAVIAGRGRKPSLFIPLSEARERNLS